MTSSSGERSSSGRGVTRQRSAGQCPVDSPARSPREEPLPPHGRSASLGAPTAVAERTWSITVPHQPRAAPVARHRLADVLSGMISSELLADVTAVVGELVGNAIRHARPLPGGIIRVSCRIGAGDDGRDVLQIRVTDGGGDPKRPRQRSADLDAVDGRGLTIVAALCTEWGVDRDGLGQSVWARLRAPRPERADAGGPGA